VKAVLLPSLREEQEGDALEVAGILPLCPPSPVVIHWVKDGKEEDGASHGPPLLGRLLQAWGVKASGATPVVPREPCGCMGQVIEATSCLLQQDFCTWLLVEAIFLSCCFQIHQLNRRVFFGP